MKNRNICGNINIQKAGDDFGYNCEHILYVNGEYLGDSDIGKLMHDFSCTKADEMNFELMAERTRYLKENPKGVNEMCKVIEDMRREEREEVALRMLKAGKIKVDEISEYTGLTIEKIEKLRTEGRCDM